MRRGALIANFYGTVMTALYAPVSYAFQGNITQRRNPKIIYPS